MTLRPTKPEKPRRTLLLALCAVAGIVLVLRFVLGGSGDPSLDSPDPEKRLIAIESLWQQDTEQARKQLRAMASDPDPRVILQSIRGMGHNRDASNRRQLQSLAAAGGSSETRREALAALGNYTDVGTEEFTRVLVNDRDAQARAGAAQALARRADKSTVPQMFRALSDPDPEVRVWAITGIKNVTFTGFMYEPSRPPHEQREVIQQIAAYLKKSGLM